MRTAWRNLWRNPRRTAITLGAVVLNTTVLILMVGWVEGVMRQLESNSTQLHLGEAQVHSPNYLRNRALDAVIENPQRILDAAAEEGIAAAPRQYGYGMAAVTEEGEEATRSSGGMIWGVSPDAERDAFRLPRHIHQGRFLDHDAVPNGEGTLPEAVIGGRLARSLRASVGDELILFGAAADGSTYEALFRVVGVLELVGEAVDRSAVLVHEKHFRRMLYPPNPTAWYARDAVPDEPREEEREPLDPFDLYEHEERAATENDNGEAPADPFELFEEHETPEETDVDDDALAYEAADYGPPWVVHEIALNSRGTLDAAEVVRTLEPEAGRDDIRTWRELNPALADMLTASQATTTVLFGIFFLIAALSVMNTMLMATYERMREFGVLKALGTGPWRLVGMVASEAALLGALAVAVGAALGSVVTAALGRVGIDLSGLMAEGTTIVGVAMDPVWRPVYEPQMIVMPIIGMWIICVLATLYPAWLAARVNPVRILAGRPT